MSDVYVSLPGPSTRPDLSEEQAQHIVERLYGVQVTSISELNSYYDRNFHIVINDKHANPYLGTVNPHGYVFKILNSLDSQMKHVEVQHEAQRRLQQRGINCPSAVRNVNGEEFTLETLSNGVDGPGPESPNKYYVRLLTFIPGKIIDKVKSTPVLLRSVGRALAQTRNALKGFNHHILRGFKYYWSLTGLSEIKKYLFALGNEEKVRFVEDFIDIFERDVLANEPFFSKCVIHGDFNGMNIIVTPGSDHSGDYKLSGIIDLGNLMESYAVYDLAIAIAYMTMCSKNMDPLAVGYHVIEGHETEASLNEAEWKVLRLCVVARYCQSMVLGHYSASLEPENPYQKETLEDSWRLINIFWNVPNEKILAMWLCCFDRPLVT